MGPAWGDVAVKIPLEAAWATGVVLHSDASFVLAADGETARLVRFDVDSADVSVIATFANPGHEGPILGDHDGLLYVALSDLVVALAPDGGELWRWAPPDAPAGTVVIINLFAALADRVLYVTATHIVTVSEDGEAGTEVALPYVAALDAVSGEQIWLWNGEAPASAGAALRPVVPAPVSRIVYGLAADEEGVIVGLWEGVVGWAGVPPASGVFWTASQHLLALRAADGAVSWSIRSEQIESGSRGPLDPLQPASKPLFSTPMSGPVVDDGVVYAAFQGLSAFNRVTGEILWTQALGAEDVTRQQVAVRPVIADGSVIAATGSTLYSLDQLDRTLQWRASLPPGEFFYGDLVATRDHLYALTSRDWGFERSRLVCYDRMDGAELWSVSGSVWLIAVANGILVADDADGLLVVGTTSASPRVAPRFASLYPAPGEEVAVDLSTSSAGLQGALSEYRVEWGDGTDSGWQGSPRLTHRYADAGEVQGRAYVRSAGGQTASAPLRFQVGEEEPNLVAIAFSPEWQEWTFFGLGLVGTAIVGGLGVVRAQRRRRLLRRELALIEEGLRNARGDPAETDRVLDERRTNARALLLGGRLDEGQHSVLASRIEELSRVHRVALVDKRLDFLPYRHVRALREMLKDGRISSVERDHYFIMLDTDTTLTAEYRARVRAVVEAWAQHDAR